MDNRSNSLHKINHQISKLARETLDSYIEHLKISEINIHPADEILLAYCTKAVDLLEGINILQDNNLFEVAQILMRSLFETNLNTGDFIRLSSEDMDEAAFKYLAAMMIMRGKSATQQELDNPSFLQEVESLRKQYSDKEVDLIERYGFTQRSIRERAVDDKKLEVYNMMYKNFSRNVHAFDFQEYHYKMGLRHEEGEESYTNRHTLRNQVALWHANICFYQIAMFCNKRFNWGIEEQLNALKNEFDQIHNED